MYFFVCLWPGSVSGPVAAQVLEALPRCASLQELHLGASALGASEQCEALAAALPRCAALEIVDLASFRLGNDGFAMLAPALPSLPRLKARQQQGENMNKENMKKKGRNSEEKKEKENYEEKKEKRKL